MPFIKLERLTKHFPGNVAALRDLTLSVEEGEWLVLFGPSGCGKTTTLRLIAGLETPSSGSIHIGGKDMAGVAPWRRGLRMLFQRPVLLPHRTIGRQLDASCAIVAQFAAFDVESLLARYPHQLSAGERQQAAFLCALAGGPRVLLLDEPLAHVDAPLRRKWWLHLGLLRSMLPATMLYVTHDPAEALGLADRLAVLERGALAQTGTPLQLLAEPGGSFLAQALSSPDDPLSLVAGRVANGVFVGPCGTWSLQGLRAPPEGPATLAAPASQFRVSQVGNADGICIIKIMERLDFGLLVCRTDHGALQVRVPPSAGFQPGQRVMIELAGNRVHWFDAAGRLVRLTRG